MSESAHLQMDWGVDEDDDEIYLDSEDEEVIPKVYKPVLQTNVIQLRRPKCVDNSTGSNVSDSKTMPSVGHELNSNVLNRTNDNTNTSAFVKRQSIDQMCKFVDKSMSTSTPLPTTRTPFSGQKTVDRITTYACKAMDTIPTVYPSTEPKSLNQNEAFESNYMNTSTPLSSTHTPIIAPKTADQKPKLVVKSMNTFTPLPTTHTPTIAQKTADQMPTFVVKSMSTYTPLPTTNTPTIGPKIVDRIPTFASKPVDTIPAFYPSTGPKSLNQNRVFESNSINTSTPTLHSSHSALKKVDQKLTFVSKPVNTIPAFKPSTTSMTASKCVDNSNDTTVSDLKSIPIVERPAIEIFNTISAEPPKPKTTVADVYLKRSVEQNCCSVQSKQLNAQFEEFLDNDLSQNTAFKRFYEYLMIAINELDGNQCLTVDEWNSRLKSKLETLFIKNLTKDDNSVKQFKQMLTQFSDLIGDVVQRSSDPNSACFGQLVTIEDLLSVKDEPLVADMDSQTDISGHILIEGIYM